MTHPEAFWSIVIAIMVILAVGAVLPTLLVLRGGWRETRRLSAAGRPHIPYRIHKMPPDLKAVMDCQIKAGVQYREIEVTLTRAGYPVNNASICRYARRQLGVARRKPLTTLTPME